MKSSKMSLKIDKIMQLNNSNPEKAMDMIDSLCDKMTISDIPLLFEDLKGRDQFQYLNELYADLFINFVYDKELKNELYNIFLQQDKEVKEKFFAMFDGIYLNFKKMNEDEGFDDLEDSENPFKVITEFYNKIKNV